MALTALATARPQSGGHYGHEDHYDHHPAYKFQYKIADKKHGDYHGQEEHRDGDKVEGVYWLVEPDGHKRIVKYRADKKSGFIAEVQRELIHHH